VRGHLALTCLAFNTAQVYRIRAGTRVAQCGIRRLRRVAQPALGASPAVIYLGECYAVLALEDLLGVLGAPVRASLRPGPAPPLAPAPSGACPPHLTACSPCGRAV